jgi:hypothetical protein
MRYISALAVLALATSTASAFRIIPSRSSESSLHARYSHGGFFEEDNDTIPDAGDACKGFSDEYQCSQNVDQCRWSKNDKACYSKLGPFFFSGGEGEGEDEHVASPSVSRKMHFLQHNSHRITRNAQDVEFADAELMEDVFELKPATPNTTAKPAQPGCQWLNHKLECATTTAPNSNKNPVRKPWKPAQPKPNKDHKDHKDHEDHADTRSADVLEEMMDIYDEINELVTGEQGGLAKLDSGSLRTRLLTPTSSLNVCRVVNGSIQCY